ncbi:LysR family transcriptional regulator [Aliiroseovarius sp. PrR006]|uniref:LysR family transcriptional regulator n=1 Tax=Aliiroseovarius sp. PrR006 TaxID=2706883 RepID=UPI0013D6C98D|nr:LysR family transcriptional regulator [Aliiroseovarius sp. PrR006]NDW53796.1 LysR family transcriptional regulator [Aliiroseovarius sp. PrR006]
MNFATFDLNLLRVLDALFREGSTVKAGTRLGLSQSAVSSALSRLRHALNDPLFVRQGNTLVPTEYAERIRQDLPGELNRIEVLLSPQDTLDPATAEGNFKIAASDFMAEMLMPKLGDVLLKKAPRLRAQLVDLVPYDYVDSLERYDADLALIPDTKLPNWISRAPLFHAPFVVIARKTNPGIAGLQDGAMMPMERFCAMPHVLFSPEGKLAAMGDAALAKVGQKRHVAMTVPVFSGVCRVVRDSDLIALIPAQLATEVKDAYGLDVFQPPMPIAPSLIIGIWHSRADKTPMAAWMRAQIFDLLRALD